jgi:hypothetical protein
LNRFEVLPLPNLVLAVSHCRAWPSLSPFPTAQFSD